MDYTKLSINVLILSRKFHFKDIIKKIYNLRPEQTLLFEKLRMIFKKMYSQICHTMSIKALFSVCVYVSMFDQNL